MAKVAVQAEGHQGGQQDAMAMLDVKEDCPGEGLSGRIGIDGFCSLEGPGAGLRLDWPESKVAAQKTLNSTWNGLKTNQTKLPQNVLFTIRLAVVSLGFRLYVQFQTYYIHFYTHFGAAV